MDQNLTMLVKVKSEGKRVLMHSHICWDKVTGNRKSNTAVLKYDRHLFLSQIKS